MNYWYVSQPNEIFLDIDNTKNSIRHCYSRLLGAVETGKLPVTNFYKYSSSSENHAHIIVLLSRDMYPIERYIWAVILRSDIYRACATTMRFIHGVTCPDVLIANKHYHRFPDNFCNCTEKHKANVMRNCIAAKLLRGDKRLEGFFGIPANLKNLKDLDKIQNFADLLDIIRTQNSV